MASDEPAQNSDILEDDINAENHIATVRKLWRYLWPSGRTDLKLRVILSMIFLGYLM